MWHATAMLGELDLIVETVFLRAGRRAAVARRPSGALPRSASGTSERPIPLGLCPKLRVTRKMRFSTSHSPGPHMWTAPGLQGLCSCDGLVGCGHMSGLCCAVGL